MPRSGRFVLGQREGACDGHLPRQGAGLAMLMECAGCGQSWDGDYAGGPVTCLNCGLKRGVPLLGTAHEKAEWTMGCLIHVADMEGWHLGMWPPGDRVKGFIVGTEEMLDKFFGKGG